MIQKVGASGNNRLSAGGPLLGNDVGSNSHKPKLQDGLLGDLDRRRKEISLIKKGGVITTSDTATEILIPQLSVVVQRMMNQLHHPTLQPSHSLLDSLKGEVSLLYNLLSQYQNQKGSTYRNDRMSMASAPQPFNSQNRLSINPFALPNISWKQTSTAASLSSSGYGKKTGTDSSSVSHSSGSYTSSAGKHTSGTENSSVHLSESSGTDDEDLPLAKSSLGSTESSSSGSEGSESEESSDSVDEDVPLGLVTDGSKIKQYSTSSQRGYPDSSYSQQSASGSLSRRPLVFVSPPSQTGTVSSQQQYQQPGMQYQQFQQQHSQGMQGLPQNQQGIKHQQFYQTGIQSQNPQYQKGMQRISQQRQSQQSFTMMPSRKSKTSGNTTPKNNSSIGSISDSSPASLRPSSVGSLSDSSKAFSPRKPRFDKSRKPRRPKPVADNSSEGSVSDESE